MGKYKLSIIVSIIIIIVGMFYLNDIDDVIEKKYESKRFNILSSVDNSVFDAETNLVSSPNEFVNQADQGLYLSKNNGRNRVTFFEPKAKYGKK